MNKQGRPKSLKELLEEGMRSVHRKLRQEKIKENEPLIVSDKNGKVTRLDPKTMKKVD